MNSNLVVGQNFDIDKPRWDQSTFYGRLQHFARITNPLLLLSSNHKLEEAREIVKRARSGALPPEFPRDEAWKAKVLYDSAFHPDTGDKMIWGGRMSTQVPVGTLVVGGMLTFYKTPLEVITLQFINQSYNAAVNYTNRNAKSSVTNKQILQAYVGATGAATAVAIGLNLLVKKAPPLIGRWVPFVAVAAANCVNIPLMRQRELKEGVCVSDKDGTELVMSERAAVTGIAQVCLSRILMVTPGMICIPILMERLQRYSLMKRGGKLLPGVIQILLYGAMSVVMIPTGCALYPQRSSIRTSRLEPEARKQVLDKLGTLPERVYFNKGL